MVKSTGLGEFIYELILTAKPAALPPTVDLKTSLGKNKPVSFTLTNYSPKDATYKISVSLKK